MAKKATADDLDVDALLGDAASSGAKKKKSNVPVITVTDSKVAASIRKYIKAQETKATIDATIKDLQEDLVPAAREGHNEALEDGSATPKTTTVKLQCEDGKAITVDVAKKQYGKIPVEEEPNLKKIFGDNYEDCFDKVMSIALTKAALADKDILKKLILAVGKENLGKYFDIAHVLKPTDTFHEGRFKDGDIKDKAEQVISEGVVNPYKPAIRV